jgi:hypothetical protein
VSWTGQLHDRRGSDMRHLSRHQRARHSASTASVRGTFHTAPFARGCFPWFVSRLAKVPARPQWSPTSTDVRHEDTRSWIAQGALWTKRPATVHSCGGDHLTRRRNVTNDRGGRTPFPASDGVRPVELRLSQRILHQKDVPEQRQGCGNDASHLLFAAQDDDRNYDEREAPKAE